MDRTRELTYKHQLVVSYIIQDRCIVLLLARVLNTLKSSHEGVPFKMSSVISDQLLISFDGFEKMKRLDT